MFNKILCPVCDGEKFSTRLNDDTPADRQVLQCLNCQLGVQPSLGPVDTHAGSVVSFYSRESYDKHQKAHSRPSALQRFNHDYYVASQRFEQMGDALPDPVVAAKRSAQLTWIDMGCSNGAFLAYARQKNFNVIGLELDKKCGAELQELLLFPCYTPAEFFLSRQKIDTENTVLSLFDVLEHFLDPVGFLTRKASLFSTVVIEVPDHSDVTDFETWKHYRPDEHLTYWTYKTFEQLLYGPKKLSRIFQIAHVGQPVKDKLQLVLRSKVFD